MRRRIGVVTVGRSDYGIYFPLLQTIQNDSECELCLIAAGAHLSPHFGNTLSEIEQDGFSVSAYVPMLLSSDSAEAVATSIGLGVIKFSSAYREVRPDIVVLLGDRFEMLAAAVSALPLRLPVAHIHGGELTRGAMDDAIRHAITKLSHLHFASAAEYGRRIEQMGEHPNRVFVTGSPVVDSILGEELFSESELSKELGVSIEKALLVTYHPVTLDREGVEKRMVALQDALSRFDNELIITYPNADMGNRIIIEKWREYSDTHTRARLFVNLGRLRYHSLQRYVSAMVGNSSSGIIEAASFCLPVVNIGDRQEGRLRTPNILDVPEESTAIEEAIRRALSEEFRRSIAGMKSPYGEGDASRQILQVLKTVSLDSELLKKKFCDWMPPGFPAVRSITTHPSLT